MTLSETPTRVLTVTALNQQVHDLLEESFSDVWVEGEVSDPRAYPSGHTYFTLKDAGSQLSAVLFKGAVSAMKFKLEHGLQVVVRGRVSTYMPRGQYQLIAAYVQPKAAGALQLAFEQLKKKLAAEGLFAPERKKPLPPFPERIGIVTSLQGAAIRDMLAVLGRRFRGLHIRIYPVQVQGEAAAPMIAEAIRDFNDYFPDTDVLLVGRGGGSLEDLWAFNEESVARAIASSRIPIVSCVGHETDFTIADFTADLRAPTPSAAAELVVSEREALLEHLDSLSERLRPGLLGLLRSLEERVRRLGASPFLLRPGRIFEQKQQRVDELAGRLAGAAQQLVSHADKDLKRQLGLLDALSPLKVLSRGYAIAFKLPEKKVLRSARDARARDRIRVRLDEGEFDAEVL